MDPWNDNCDIVGCAAKSAPEMTLWTNFFPEPILQKVSSRDLLLGYAGYGSKVVLGRFQGSLDEGFDRFPHLRDEYSIFQGQCRTRLLELHDSTSSVMLAVPVVRSPPFSQRGEMEICPSTSLLSHSPAFPTYRQNSFCVRRDKTTNSVAFIAELSSMVSPR